VCLYISLHETWYIYVSWNLSPSERVLYKSLPSVCVCICMPPVAGRQRLRNHVPATMNTCNNRRIVGHIIFYAVRVAWKESRQWVRPRTSCYIPGTFNSRLVRVGAVKTNAIISIAYSFYTGLEFCSSVNMTRPRVSTNEQLQCCSLLLVPGAVTAAHALSCGRVYYSTFCISEVAFKPPYSVN
jgi:hypothetical protein